MSIIAAAYVGHIDICTWSHNICTQINAYDICIYMHNMYAYVMFGKAKTSQIYQSFFYIFLQLYSNINLHLIGVS